MMFNKFEGRGVKLLESLPIRLIFSLAVYSPYLGLPGAYFFVSRHSVKKR